MNIIVKKLKENVILPTKAHENDACFDIYAHVANNYVTIAPNETAKIRTGFATAIPAGYCALVYARSGLATKYGLRPANCVGVIDADYRGEWIVALHNDSKYPQDVVDGERIAQFMIVPVPDTKLIEADELNETNRGKGGFGSSGK